MYNTNTSLSISTEECMIIEASCTKKTKSVETNDLSNYEHIVANSLLNLSSHNNHTTSQQQQHHVAIETKGDNSTRTQEQENNEGNRDGRKAESQTTAQIATINGMNEEIKNEMVKEEENERQEKSDHQYSTEEINKELSEDVKKPQGQKTCNEEYKKDEDVTDQKLEQYDLSDPSVNVATQGSQKEDYNTQKPLSPQSCMSSQASAAPMIIEVQSEESEKDDEIGDDEEEQSMMADESEMYDMMRGNLRLLEQAIALKAQQVKGNREFTPITEHHRYFPLDDRSTKHMELLRKSYYSKGMNISRMGDGGN